MKINEHEQPVYTAFSVDEPAEDQFSETAPGAIFSPKSVNALDALARITQQNRLEHIRDAVFVTEQISYLWTLEDDALTWSENLSEVLRGVDVDQAKTGRGFASLLDRANECSRFNTVIGSSEIDAGDGVGYCIEYRIWPGGLDQGQPFWVEDTGRWYAGEAGKPAYAIGVVKVIDERRIREEKLNYLSERDPLTGFMNRATLIATLADAINAAERSNESYGFVLAALDNLDVVNDAFGFEVADQVISAVSERLKSAMRGGDAIGRYAGNKFGIILSECDDDDIEVAAERFLDVVRGAVIETDKGPVWATISLGGCLLPKYADTVQHVIVHSEEALSDAKRRPTDCFVPFKPSKERASIRERNVACAAEIVSALNENHFVLAFQPIIDASTRKVHMYEGLLRLLDENGEALSAGHLLPVAEKLGLIRLIDRRVLEMGLDVLEKNPEIRLSLNISGITATDARWFEQIIDYIAEHQNVCHRLVLEITETVELFAIEEIVRFIARLRELGCAVAIDDFGAGYTSFRNLQLLNVDMVKLDGSFCEGLSETPGNQYFVKTLIDMANRFDLDVVAEWVQNEEDAQLLQSWGVTLLQGNLFGAATLTPEWGGMGQPGPMIPHPIDPLAVTQLPSLARMVENETVKHLRTMELEEMSSSDLEKGDGSTITPGILFDPFNNHEKTPEPEAFVPDLTNIPDTAPESLFTSSRKPQIPESTEAQIAAPDDQKRSTSAVECDAGPPGEKNGLSDDQRELMDKLTRAFGSPGNTFPPE
jgi:diguanylate cyclase (GGDEF)-like protein